MPKRVRFYFFLGGGALFLILFHLYLSTRIIDLNDQNTTLKIQLDDLQGKNRESGVLIEQKLDLDVLEEKAKKLGYRSPDQIYYLLLPTTEADIH